MQLVLRGPMFGLFGLFGFPQWELPGTKKDHVKNQKGPFTLRMDGKGAHNE
jgi:hypothetical protein